MPDPGTQRQLEVLNEIARIATLDLELRPMLQRVTDTLRRKFDWEFVACASVDNEHGVFVCESLSTLQPTQISVGYTRALGSGVVGEVAQTGRSILLDDVSKSKNFIETMTGTRSELCVPVKHQGRTIAVLNLESTQLKAFHDQLPLLETVAEQIAGAIVNANLYLEVRRKAQLLEMVSEVSRTALDEPEKVLDRIVSYVHRQFGLYVVAIMLYDRKKKEFELAAHAGPANPLSKKGLRWPVKRGVIGRALRLGEVQFVPDVRNDPDYTPFDDRVTSELVVPIRFRDEMLGVFNLESTAPEVFTPENRTVFRTFADQLAGAIHLATVNLELEEANERLRESNRTLEQLSLIDPLTGIANRRLFDQTIEVEWRRARRGSDPIALILADIDCFKNFNDALGHQRGDECLRQVADAMRKGLSRAGDLLARYGGEEFIAILPGLDAEEAMQHADRLRSRVEKLGLAHPESSASNVVTISLGVAAAYPGEGSSPESLFTLADRALYAAKHAGRNRVEMLENEPR